LLLVIFNIEEILFIFSVEVSVVETESSSVSIESFLLKLFTLFKVKLTNGVVATFISKLLAFKPLFNVLLTLLTAVKASRALGV